MPKERINGRNKGNRGERDFARVLGDWTGKKFARVPSSGGLNWKASHAKGDIVVTEEGHFFPFCVEVKTYKELNFQHLLYLEKAEILKFWKQCSRDADKANKAPLLAMRTNSIKKDFYFLIMNTEHFEKILLFDSTYDYSPIRTINIDNLGLKIIHSIDFFKEISYKKIRKPLKLLMRNK